MQRKRDECCRLEVYAEFTKSFILNIRNENNFTEHKMYSVYWERDEHRKIKNQRNAKNRNESRFHNHNDGFVKIAMKLSIFGRSTTAIGNQNWNAEPEPLNVN